MKKSRFDVGSTLGNGRWDEEEHPRGSDGRFTSGGSAEPAAKKPAESKPDSRVARYMEAQKKAALLREERQKAIGTEELKGTEFSYGEDVHWRNGPFDFEGKVVGYAKATGLYKVKTDRGEVTHINGKIYKKGEKPKFFSTPFGRVYR